MILGLFLTFATTWAMPACELFLLPRFPLYNGRLPADLSARVEIESEDSLVYHSEIGAVHFTRRDFEDWVHSVGLSGNGQYAAKAMLQNILRRDNSALGSEFQTRLRNTFFLERKRRELARDYVAMERPKPGSKIDAHSWSSVRAESEIQTLKLQRPSLNFKLVHVDNGDLSVEGDKNVLRLMRVAHREALYARWDPSLSLDQRLLLSVHPELTGIWPVARAWKIPANELRIQAKGWFSSPPLHSTSRRISK